MKTKDIIKVKARRKRCADNSPWSYKNQKNGCINVGKTKTTTSAPTPSCKLVFKKVNIDVNYEKQVKWFKSLTQDQQDNVVALFLQVVGRDRQEGIAVQRRKYDQYSNT